MERQDGDQNQDYFIIQQNSFSKGQAIQGSPILNLDVKGTDILKIENNQNEIEAKEIQEQQGQQLDDEKGEMSLSKQDNLILEETRIDNIPPPQVLVIMDDKNNKGETITIMEPNIYQQDDQRNIHAEITQENGNQKDNDAQAVAMDKDSKYDDEEKQQVEQHYIIENTNEDQADNQGPIKLNMLLGNQSESLQKNSLDVPDSGSGSSNKNSFQDNQTEKPPLSPITFGSPRKSENRQIINITGPSLQEQKQMGYEDFEKLGRLGNGAYGDVVLVRRQDNSDNRDIALQLIDQQFLAREQKQYQVYIERQVLKKLQHPGIIKLYYSFQDQDTLYFGLEYADGGEFSQYLKINNGQLPLQTIVFYLAEIIVILEYIHQSGIIHRDLKPENMILNQEGHLKLIDFGTAQIFNNNLIPKSVEDGIKDMKEKNQRKVDPVLMHDQDYQKEIEAENERSLKDSFVGTAEYVSPELLNDSLALPASDLWALGCVAHQMWTGKTPFYAQTQFLVFNQIKQGKITLDPKIPADLKDFIGLLLTVNHSERLGYYDPKEEINYTKLQEHVLFKGIDFDNIYNSDPPEREILSPSRKQQNQINEFGFPGSFENEKQEESQELDVHPVPEEVQEEKENEEIIRGKILQKKFIFFYRPRIIAVYQNPNRVCYYDGVELQAQLMIDSKFVVQLDQDQKKLSVENNGLKYEFMEEENEIKMTAVFDAIVSLINGGQNTPKKPISKFGEK